MKLLPRTETIMTRSILLFICTGFLVAGFSQTLTEEVIRRSGEYYYGEGEATNRLEARDAALTELSQSISVTISSSLSTRTGETDDNISTETEALVKSYTQATLHNYQMLTSPKPGGRIRVFAYISRTEVERIFDDRKALILQLYREAGKYLRQYNVAQSLKTCYFADILLKSLPDQVVSVDGVQLTTAIPDRINTTLRSLEFSYEHDRQPSPDVREVTINVTLEGHPVALLDFTFWDGSDQVQVQARDGVAVLELFGGSIHFQELKVNIKYVYYESRGEYSPVETLWSTVRHSHYAADRTVKLKRGFFARKPVVSENWKINLNWEPAAGDVPEAALATRTRELVVTLEAGKDSVAIVYGGDPFLKTKLAAYLRHNRAKPTDKALNLLVNPTRNGWESRRVRMRHEYPSLNRQSTEYLVLDYSPEGVLQDMNLAVNDFLFTTFVRQSEYSDDWPNRLEIIKFLEKYRTAFMTRDLAMVDKLFAEEALIIVGRRVETRKLKSGDVEYERLDQRQPSYEYLEFTKAEYLSRQREIFRRQQDLALDFSTFNIVRKNNAPSVYGIEMRQNYAASSYADEGYLFLLIDFSGADPLIYVRSWQPDAWDENELIRTANFKIYK